MLTPDPSKLFLAGALALLLGACTANSDSAPAESGADPAVIQTALGKADLVDGTEDKVVSNCLTCNLGMAGDASHASTLEGYTLHLCSEKCLKRFEGDKEKALLAARLPK